jgi:transcription termination factor NusB
MNEFEKMVLEMRELQKEYFRTRDRGVLEKSKQAERKIDEYLNNKTNPKLQF